ncbi:alpha/beta hydrolase [Streptomyces californicus]
MDATGFAALAARFPDRTVVTYDPRGLGRSTRKDGRAEYAPESLADDVHAVIEALGVGPVETFASSGGAVTALALVARHPEDVTTLVAHEPPLITLTPDGPAAVRARAGVRDAYEARGWGAGMAAFVAMTSSWRASSPTPTSRSRFPTPPRSACPPRTTARGTTRCCPTGPGRSATTCRTSRRSRRPAPGW